MTNYRRYYVKGGTYFFTVALAHRQSTLLTYHADQLGNAFRAVRLAHPFQTHAVVVLPDHLHCVWTLPQGDGDFSTRWRQIKSAFSRSLPPGEDLSCSRKRKAERGIWQRRFWEHAVRDEGEMQRIVDYIHYNPVKHAHVTKPNEWPHSSFHRYVRQGLLSSEWGANIEAGDVCGCSEPIDG